MIVAGPEARPYHLVLHENPGGWDITQERQGYMLAADTAFRDVNPVELDGMVITGGRASGVSAIRCRLASYHEGVVRGE